MRDTVLFLRRTPSAVLLIVQLIGVLLYPFLEGSVTARAITAGFGLIVLGVTLLAIRATPMVTWVAVLMAAPAFVLLGIQVFTSNEALTPYAAFFEWLLYFYAAVAMLRYLLSDDHVSQDDLFALAAVFTLMAWGFANLFVVVQAIWPGSFTAAVNPEAQRSWPELLFLSFTNLSSTGLSDVAPIKAHARSVVMFEQIIGVFYLAMVVTRLVGMQGKRGDSEGRGASEEAER